MSVVDEQYLIFGLDALSRAHEANYFVDGHRGAAIIAAYYFCREVDIEAGAPKIIQAMIDEHWRHMSLCAPLPEEPPASDGIERILKTLELSIGRLRQAGHNVIFPSLALKALHQLPEAITPLRVNGICRLIESFTVTDDIRVTEEDAIPDLGPSPTAAEFILTEFLRTVKAFDGRGQGWSGHLLTYGRALLDLRELGYGALAVKGEAAFKQYIKRIRMGPLDTDKVRTEHVPSTRRPDQRAYWNVRQKGSVEIGHVFKYPYGFYGLLRYAGDTVLRTRCLDAGYHIF